VSLSGERIGRTLTRRELLQRGAAAAGGLALSGAPSAQAASTKFDGTIRVLGIGYDIEAPGVRERAEKDLGFPVVSVQRFPPDIQRLVAEEPATFDVFSCFAQDIAEFWTSDNLQPLEIARIERWGSVTPLYRLGKVQPGAACTYGQGDAAFRRLYVDPERSGRWPSAAGTPPSVSGELVQWVNEKTGNRVGPEPRMATGLPHCFNFDSFGYNADLLAKRPGELSWKELLNPRWRGRVALNGVDPQGALQDVANAVQAAGLMRIRNFGDPTRSEIDRLVKILLAYRRKGQFFNVWRKPIDAVGWMRSGQIVVSAMWAAQIASLAALDFPVRQAAPREGYRAFAGLMTISSAVTDPARLDALYAFLNWWHSGFAGSVVMRQGYYSAVQGTTRRFVTPGEYAYWIEGKPANRNYRGPYGDKSVRKSRVRDGGAFTRRACRISSWNSTPAQQQYFLERWQEFISGF
jgi:putative spermidine/putrescine transport system substrate-binding protein